MCHCERPDDELITAYQAGDEEAAARLFERYYDRLTSLAHQQLGWDLKGIEDSTDLAQSVFHSVFMKCRERQIVIGPDESLWPLLATVTLNKARNRRKFYRRKKRDRRRQVQLDDHDPLQHNPSPEDAAILKELIEGLIESFGSERRQRIITLLLQGHCPGDVAAQLGTSERTVYKTREAAIHVLTRVLVEE